MSILASMVLIVIASFTLFVLVLVAASFTLEEAGLWAEDVVRTFGVQLFITGPVVGLFVIAAKLAVVHVLLRAAGKRTQQKL